MTGDEKVFDFMVLNGLEAKILKEDTSKIDSVKFLLEEKVATLRYELMDKFFVANELFATGEIENEAFIDVGITNVFALIDTDKMLLGTKCNLETLVNGVDAEKALCDTVCITVWLLEILRLNSNEKLFNTMLCLFIRILLLVMVE